MRKYKGFEVITDKQGLVTYLQQDGCRSVVYKKSRQERRWNVVLEQKNPMGKWITFQMREGLQKKWDAMRIAAELLRQLLDDQKWIDPSSLTHKTTTIWEYIPLINVWVIHRSGFHTQVGIEVVRQLNQHYRYPNKHGRHFKLFGEGVNPNKVVQENSIKRGESHEDKGN